MAYDPNAAYEAPRRPYYGQTHQRAPAQPMRRSPPHEQRGNSHGQGYDLTYDQRYDSGYGQQQYGTWDGHVDQWQQEPTYSNGYDAKDQHPQDPQYSNQHQPQMQQQLQQQPGRSHDPRFHQRLQKASPQRAHGYGNESGPPRPPQQAERQGYQVQPQNYHKPVDSRNDMPQADTRRKHDGYEPGTRGPVASAKSFGNGNGQDAMSQQKPRKLTMEEWKANERAKMHSARPPETVAQDNAFPKFHNIKNGQKHVGSHGGENVMGNGHRSSEEHARPVTSGSHSRDGGQQHERPNASQDKAFDAGPHRQHDSAATSRPSTDQPYSFDSMRNHLPAAQDLRRPMFDRSTSEGFARPAGFSDPKEEYRERQQPVHDQQSFSHTQLVQDAGYGQSADFRSGYQNARPGSNHKARSNQNNQHSRPPIDAQQSRPDSRSPANAQGRLYHATDSRQQSDDARYRQQAQTRDHIYDAAPYASRDTADVQGPAFMDHQPPAPAYLPERSSSAQGSRRPSAAQGSSTLSQHHQEIAVKQAGGLQVPEHNNKHVSLTDLYEDYHQDRNSAMPASAVAPASQTREDEIEAEMPDFDSAAPAQTSMLHKRNQTVDRHLANGLASAPPPPMPMNSNQSINPSGQSVPVHSTQTHQSPYQLPQQPHQDVSDRGQMNQGSFDFGLQQTAQDPSYNERRQPPLNQQQRPAFDHYAAPQPPFAKQTLPRRSMDDTRQMPHQQAPQSQRSYGISPSQDPRQNRAIGNTSQPPFDRPDIDRHASAQTTWSDPGIQRVLSAPVTQAGLPRPPRSSNGVGPEYQQQSTQDNSDTLPRHPTPVRPGLLEQAPAQPAKPPPVRNYNTASMTSTTPSVPPMFDRSTSEGFARPAGFSDPKEEYRERQQPVHDQQSFSHTQLVQDAGYGQSADFRSGYQNARPGSNHKARSNQNNQHSRPPIDAQQSRPDSRSPANAQGRLYHATDSRQQSDDARYRQQAQTRDHIYDAAPYASRDTADVQGPAFMDHQPPAPAYLPERSSSAQGSRRPSAAQGSSTLSQHHQEIAVKQAGGLQVPEHNNKHVSLTDLYEDYHQDRNSAMPASAVAPASQTREDEIEAEMPDFDSAAPAQTSMLHKRNQTVDRHLANGLASAPPPPMPMNSNQSINPSGQSVPVHSTQTHQSPYQLPQQPHQDVSDRGQMNQGSFDFGLQQTAQDPSYNERRQPPLNQQQRPAFDHYAAPQPPFAKQTLPRRSMDDTRQMPHQQAPQSQRSYGISPSQDPRQNRAIGNTSQPPFDRPDIDRHASAQTTWSDPGIQRVLSAPVTQAGLPRPPRSSNGVGPEYQQQSTQDNSDTLPRHPTPVRPGLLEQAPAQPAKPPPVRNYCNTASMTSTTPSVPSHQKAPSLDHFAQPVTRAELERLQTAVNANPNSPKQALIYVKKLVEAASVLASEGGKADTKTTNKNRERYLTEAYKRLKKLAAASYPDAQFFLADCHGSGMLGLVIDPKEAFNLYQAAAKQGHGQAAYRTAVCCEIGPDEGGGTRKDLAKAVQWYRRAAALGDVAAMYKLGMILLKGLLGQQENVGEAVSWLKRSAERADRENPHALHELGTLYEPANTNPRVRNKIIADEKYARELFQQAAGLGYKTSQFRLGQAYEYGHLGLPLDHRSSIQWYSKAAAQGEHQAELALSGWYLTGAEGILEQNDVEAYLWARKAASSEPPLAKAMFAMGYFSEQGIGCPASLDDARRWYGRAASYKFPKALERLEELKKNGKQKAAPVNGKLSRKDQKKDEADCVVM
nr:chitin synthase regulatory factor 3 [Quercus suber]